jgi:dipeptidyl aminopeptidase/acylaminoacyl peptidase
MRLALLIAAAAALPATGFAAQALHVFKAAIISPDGKRVASIETQDSNGDEPPEASLFIRDLEGKAMRVALPCAAGPDCTIGSPAWSSDGRQLAFLLANDKDGSTDIETVDAGGGTPHRVLHFAGPLDGLRYGPGGRLAVLATANAHKVVGRAEAGAPVVGEIGTETDEQRIAVVNGAALRFVSPPDLYVYEFDWRPQGGFVGTAAHGDGDSNWWIARLYAFDENGASHVLFAPGPREQLATPAVSPDGKNVAFIGGWMSDFGSTGGDAFELSLDRAGAAPINLTHRWHSTVTALNWHCGAGLTGVTLAGDTLSIVQLDKAGAQPAWSGQQSLSGGPDHSMTCSASAVAAIASSFTAPPEIVAGPIGHFHAITHENNGITAPLTARSVTWKNDGLTVQGWLLSPKSDDATTKRPMIELVHGGPEAAATSQFLPDSSTARTLLAQGWEVFEPNYRGSFGQGEAFAAASIQDIGGGDWRDVLTGVDAAEHAAPIDDNRLAIMGGSYGGYMTMWGVTQTHRFRAGMSHAGVSDWLSIEGEAPQAGSDEVNFGGSVYDNAAPYLKASPVMHMRGVKTPVLVTVGERDLECPMPQSQEFYTALKALNVPVSFVVYPGEGHHLNKARNRDDEQRRTVAWFRRWFSQDK